MEKTKVKCPKCKSSSLTITENWSGHAIEWEQNEGLINRNLGNLNPGDPEKLWAICHHCSHKWTIKGCTQITDILIP